MRIFITLMTLSLLQGNILRLSPEFYDNRIPKSIYTYKETSNKIILKESTSYYKNGQMSYKVEYDSDGLNNLLEHNHKVASRELSLKKMSQRLENLIIEAGWTHVSS